MVTIVVLLPPLVVNLPLLVVLLPLLVVLLPLLVVILPLLVVLLPLLVVLLALLMVLLLLLVVGRQGGPCCVATSPTSLSGVSPCVWLKMVGSAVPTTCRLMAPLAYRHPCNGPDTPRYPHCTTSRHHHSSAGHHTKRH